MSFRTPKKDFPPVLKMRKYLIKASSSLNNYLFTGNRKIYNDTSSYSFFLSPSLIDHSLETFTYIEIINHFHCSTFSSTHKFNKAILKGRDITVSLVSETTSYRMFKQMYPKFHNTTCSKNLVFLEEMLCKDLDQFHIMRSYPIEYL